MSLTVLVKLAEVEKLIRHYPSPRLVVSRCLTSSSLLPIGVSVYQQGYRIYMHLAARKAVIFMRMAGICMSGAALALKTS